jgi:hypothetical protein
VYNDEDVFIAIYVDDCLIVGDDEAIKDAIKGLTEDFPVMAYLTVGSTLI